jgi:hypothetical protein
VKRSSVVVSDGRGMHAVGGGAQPANVVRRMLVIAILRRLQRDRRDVRSAAVRGDLGFLQRCGRLARM